jgi:pyruvate dehydrogenase E1 component
VADLIRPYVPGRYVALGTDGFGRSDTRAALRDFFEVDAKHIVVAALAALEGPEAKTLAAEAVRRYGIDAGARPPWQR